MFFTIFSFWGGGGGGYVNDTPAYQNSKEILHSHRRTVPDLLIDNVKKPMPPVAILLSCKEIFILLCVVFIIQMLTMMRSDDIVVWYCPGLTCVEVLLNRQVLVSDSNWN